MKPPAPPRIRYPEFEQYWVDPPPEPSARCLWWVDRINGGWRRNRRIGGLGYSMSAEYFGVYIWEWLHVLSPLLRSKGG